MKKSKPLIGLIIVFLVLLLLMPGCTTKPNKMPEGKPIRANSQEYTDMCIRNPNHILCTVESK